MKRLVTLLVAALMLVGLSGLTFAEEAKPAEKKVGSEAKPEKTMKKAKKVKKGEAAVVKKEDATAKAAAKPAKKKKEAAGC